MHIAETREQARADMEFGTLRLADYMEALGGVKPPFASSTEKMLERAARRGLPGRTAKAATSSSRRFRCLTSGPGNYSPYR